MGEMVSDSGVLRRNYRWFRLRRRCLLGVGRGGDACSRKGWASTRGRPHAFSGRVEEVGAVLLTGWASPIIIVTRQLRKKNHEMHVATTSRPRGLERHVISDRVRKSISAATIKTRLSFYFSQPYQFLEFFTL
ncbi:hypothetical protein YC2023_090714 [Brassica napus]